LRRGVGGGFELRGKKLEILGSKLNERIQTNLRTNQ